MHGVPLWVDDDTALLLGETIAYVSVITLLILYYSNNPFLFCSTSSCGLLFVFNLAGCVRLI